MAVYDVTNQSKSPPISIPYSSGSSAFLGYSFFLGYYFLGASFFSATLAAGAPEATGAEPAPSLACPSAIN